MKDNFVYDKDSNLKGGFFPMRKLLSFVLSLMLLLAMAVPSVMAEAQRMVPASILSGMGL